MGYSNGTIAADSILTDNDAFNNRYDMDTITGYNRTATGIEMYAKDGNGYYLEVTNKPHGNAQMFYICTKEDFNTLVPVLKNRNGKVIIAIIQGIVLDSDGKGVTTYGNEILYDMSKFTVVDRIQSTLIYNHENNDIEDILYRIDTPLESY